MISNKLRALYYFLFFPAMFINGKFYKHFRQPTSGLLKVHLGPGKENYIKDWINLDANIITAKIDIWTDLNLLHDNVSMKVSPNNYLNNKYFMI